MQTFELLAVDSETNARCGEIVTDHGTIQTPIFMPVGTAGTVKAVHQRELKEDIGAQIILGNTYHLYLRPGTEVLEEAKGLHQFNGWSGPILTDSGGFQVYSLSGVRTIREEGVTFQSHIDGSKHLFTPERSMDIQRSIGADIVMAFDECAPNPSEHAYAREAMARTHRWLKRCQTHFDSQHPKYGYHQSLFPIVQGSTYKDLRVESAEFVASLGCAGNAIGGLSVGEEAEVMYEMTQVVCDILPKDKPRYLMGVGTPADILECIGLGVDMFDCVMPTRNARNGMCFTTQGTINIRNTKWQKNFSALDPGLACFASQHYSKAYLSHLIRSKEILAAQIASVQNLRFYLWLVEQARLHIQAGDFRAWKKEMLPIFMQRL